MRLVIARILILAFDGDSMIDVPARDFRTRILADGAVLHQQCEGQKCKAVTLPLFDRPR
jgi:hypothetical protein